MPSGPVECAGASQKPPAWRQQGMCCLVFPSSSYCRHPKCSACRVLRGPEQVVARYGTAVRLEHKAVAVRPVGHGYYQARFDSRHRERDLIRRPERLTSQTVTLQPVLTRSQQPDLPPVASVYLPVGPACSGIAVTLVTRIWLGVLGAQRIGDALTGGVLAVDAVAHIFSRTATPYPARRRPRGAGPGVQPQRHRSVPRTRRQGQPA
jgi:hypothetical protein